MKKSTLKTILPYVLCWIIAISIGLYFRMYPLTQYGSSDAYDKATMIVISRLKAQTTKRIINQFPHLDALKRRTLIKRSFDSLLHEESDMVKQSIDKVSRQLDKTASSKRFPYMLGSDSYYYLGLTQNIVENGTISNTIKGSKYLNTLMMAPYGHWTPLNLHPYIGYAIYKILQIFYRNIDLAYAVSFTPLVMVALTLGFYIAICRLLNCGKMSSFIGAIFFLLAPIFVKRSAFGWYDNDPYNALFPLMILFFFFKGLDFNSSKRKGIFYGIVCAALFGLYAFFWQGWVYMFCIILITGALIIPCNHYITKKKEVTKNLVRFLVAIVCGTLFVVSISFGIKDFFMLFAEGWQALVNFLEPKLSSWPDIFISVGELKRISPADVIKLNGGILFFCISLFGLISYGYQLLRETPQKSDPLKFIGICVFLIFSIVISLGALRFALFTLIPLAILIPTGIDSACLLVKKWITKHASYLSGKRTAVVIGWAICIPLLMIIPMRNAHTEMIKFRPIFNDTWDAVLHTIKDRTPKDSIINTWWSPGHFITSIARRRVTFDGATINTPQAYWIANIFLSNDERHAAGLLRMLNNSGNRAVELLQEVGLNLSSADGQQKHLLPLIIKKLHEIAPLNKKDARGSFKNLLDDNNIEQLLTLTHSQPPPSYILVYSELVEKNLQLSFIGRWDFGAIETLRNDTSALRAIPRRNTKEYIAFLWKSVGGPLRYSEIIPALDEKNEKVFFAHNIVVNLKDVTCQIDSDKFGSGIPYSIVYLNGNSVVEKKLNGANLGFTILLFKHQKHFNCIVLDPRLARSLLIKLYFFEGKGLRYFQPFIEKTDLTGRTRIYVYKVDWERFRRDLMEN